MLTLPGWNDAISVQAIHSTLEGGALLFFAGLVLFDVLAHLAERESTKEKHLERIGLAFFAVAVLAEVLAYPYGRRADSLSSSRIAELNLQAGKALERASAADERAHKFAADAEGFREQIAAANERAANAQALAKRYESAIAESNAMARQAEERTAQAELELARIQLPRSLNADQKQRIAHALSPFSGTNFGFLVFGDPESLAFLLDLDDALRQAGWNRVNAPPTLGSDIGFNTPGGMVSQVNDVGLKAYFPADAPEMKSIVLAVSAAISAERVPCEPRYSDRMRGYSPKMILISVGQKRF